jgi:hypothetical protein
MRAFGRRFLQIRIVLLSLQRALHELGHGSVLEIEKFALLRKNTREVFNRKTIMAGRHRRVCGEHALGADFFDVFAIDRGAARLYGFLAEQFQREECGVALVHVVAREIFISERAKHAHATDSQKNFLAQPVVGIAAIESASEVAVPFGVGREIGIEKIDRHFKVTHTLNVIAPTAQFDAAIFQRHGNAHGLFFKEIFDVPNNRFFRLATVFGEMLRKVAPAVKERYGHHGQTQVRGGTDSVSCENTQAATVARHGVLQRNLHGKIGNKAFNRIRVRGHLSRFSAWRLDSRPAGKMGNN